MGNGALAGEGFAEPHSPPHASRTCCIRRMLILCCTWALTSACGPGMRCGRFSVLGRRLPFDVGYAGDLRLLRARAGDPVGMSDGDGRARTDDGREIEGLSAIVQQRGARQVVASLWRVEDSSTAQLMRSMYQELAVHPTTWPLRCSRRRSPCERWSETAGNPTLIPTIGPGSSFPVALRRPRSLQLRGHVVPLGGARSAGGCYFSSTITALWGSGDQLLGVAAIAGIESNLARVIGVDGPLARRAHGLQRTSSPKRNNDILVVEMHGRGSTRKPEYCQRSRGSFPGFSSIPAGEGAGKSGRVHQRLDRRILQGDDHLFHGSLRYGRVLQRSSLGHPHGIARRVASRAVSDHRAPQIESGRP